MKAIPFSVLKKSLQATDVSYANGGVYFRQPGTTKVVMTITPCVNIRSNNFTMLVSQNDCLSLFSVFLTDDCASIFKDAASKAEFFDLIRSKTKDRFNILATGTKGIIWDRIGSRIIAKIGTTEMISYRISGEPVEDAESRIRIPYRGIYMEAESRFFTGCACNDLFAYSLVGNAVALINSESGLPDVA